MPAWLGRQSVAVVRMFPSSIYFESSKWIGALTTTSDGDDVDNEGGYVTCPGAILFHLKVKCRPTNSLPAQRRLLFLFLFPPVELWPKTNLLLPIRRPG